jgi:prepilin-type N-terminal cleavage/methylation domain-containing protein
MERVAMFNKKGVTLIEMMIALVILLVVSLALMQTAIIGMNVNLQNILRDEAVNIAEMRMNQLRSLPYDSILPGAEAPVTRTFRGFTETYTPTRIVSTLLTSTNIKQVTISVSWDYRGKTYSHGITTIVRKQ